MRDPVQAQLDAYNAHDIEAFVACFSEDCISEDGEGKRIFTGKSEMRIRYQTLLASSPKLHAEVVQRIRIGEHVIDEERITGRNPPMSRAVVVFHVRGELIDHIRFYHES